MKTAFNIKVEHFIWIFFNNFCCLDARIKEQSVACSAQDKINKGVAKGGRSGAFSSERDYFIFHHVIVVEVNGPLYYIMFIRLTHVRTSFVSNTITQRLQDYTIAKFTPCAENFTDTLFCLLEISFLFAL